MTTQVLELTDAQSLIYTRTNIRRAFQDFDDTDVGGIYLFDDQCRIVYRDGAQVDYPRQQIKAAYKDFTDRLPDFFSYLGPNYMGPTIWHNSSLVLFKGWSYVHASGQHTFNAKLQQRWADKLMRITDEQQLKQLLQSDQTDIGYLVAPEGFRYTNQTVDMDSELGEDIKPEPVAAQPFCSCGSFQRQLSNLQGLQQEIEGFKPWCKHLSYIQKFRDLCSRRTELRNACPAYAPDKCVAWWYAPPADATSDGKFMLLYTKYGAQAPLSHWRNYRPKESFNQHDAWDLFFNMMDAGYVPFPGTSLPQLTRNKKSGEHKVAG